MTLDSAKTAGLCALLSVGPWRNAATGEEKGDLLILFERANGSVGRLRLTETDAQSLADSIVALRASMAARRARRSAREAGAFVAGAPAAPAAGSAGAGGAAAGV